MGTVNNYLRLAIMFSDNHATTFITNLEKMIELVLNAQAPRALHLAEIVTCLSIEYNLNFTDTEVIRSIESSRGKENIVCIDDTVRYSDRKYTLTENAIEKIQNKINSVSISNICSLFLQEKAVADIDADTMEELVGRYFYRCFNGNATTMLQLLKQQYEEGVLLSNEDEDAKFSDTEKEILNSFIFWDNEDKDKFVYQMVSCCFDYCTMTVKKDPKVYETVFKNKCFILDTNIIFRIMGINRDSRKLVIDSFLKKCKEVGLKLAVTNITRAEIHSTINFYIDRISDLIGNTAPVKTDYTKGCRVGFNEDFYQCYYEWCNEKKIKAGNIQEFREELLKQADIVCRRFENIQYSSFEVISKEKFDSYTQDLMHYKNQYKPNVREETVQTDVNNFMYVVGLNERNHAGDFFSLSYFHITADHIFCSWSKSIRPGAIPVVVLPSVWYSIILHYSGRAADNNDYAAFTRFLYFSLSTKDSFIDERKAILLKKVALLNETVDVKEEILLDVGKKLSEEYSDIDESEIEVLIQESNITITKKHVTEAEERQKQISALENKKLKAESAEKLAKLREEQNEKIFALQRESQQQQREYEETLKRKEKEHGQALLKAKDEERSKYIDREAEEKAKRLRRIYIVLMLLLFLLPLVLLLIAGSVEWELPLPNSNNISTGIPIVLTICWEGIVYKIIYGSCFCELKIDAIEARERKLLEEKFPKPE